jgi:hypothetical protein
MTVSPDRIRARTAASVLRRIDEDTQRRVEALAAAGPVAIADRLHDLDREWDTDRTIELEASTMALAELALGIFARPAFLAIPAIVGGAVLAHAVTGWYPLLPLFRRLGTRSAREIERERHAVKALRGDFDRVPPPDGVESAARARAALAAVDA